MSDELRVIEGGGGKERAVLRSLTLTGFKSFAQRTYLEFAPGITAIVGPNGSGKSNVAEAVRWALGEGSAKALRAKKSEDLIFAGSETRRAIGMAEVVMHLDNSSGRLPVSFTEVEIARRFFRSTESEYLINRAKVRLRDLQDLLAGAHLADNPFVVIGQGLVDQVLALRPAERRIVIEEAAGTRRLHLRREEALHKIKAAELELVRVNDVLREIGPRVELLREQAAKWQEYEAVRAELRRRALRWYRESFGESASARDELRERLADVDAELVALVEEVTRAEGAATVGEEGLAYAREAEERARVESEAAARAVAEARERLASVRSSHSALIAQRERVVEAMAALPAEIVELRDRLRGVETESSSSAETAARAAETAADVERALAQRHAAAAAASAQRLAAEREVLVREGAEARARAEAEALERRLSEIGDGTRRLHEERTSIERERDDVASRLRAAHRDADELDREISELETTVERQRIDLNRIDGDLAKARGERTAVEGALERARDELALRRSALATELPSLPKESWWLFDRLRLAPDLERAVRATLAAPVAIVDAISGLEALRGSSGVIAVAPLPTDTAASRFGRPLADALEPLDPGVRVVVRTALAGTYLVEDESAAIASAAELPVGIRLVTRGGLLVARGLVRFPEDAADELDARRRIAQLEAVAEGLAAEAEATRRRVADLVDSRQATVAALAGAEESLAREKHARATHGRTIEELERTDATMHDRMRSIDARLAALDEQRAEIRDRTVVVAKQREAAAAARAAAAEGFARAEAAERDAISAQRQSQASAARARLESATAEERRVTLARLRDALADQIGAAERRLAVESERARELEAQEAELARKVAQAEREEGQLDTNSAAMRGSWDGARERARAAEGARRESEQRAARARERMAELRGERARLAAEVERASAALRLLDEQVRAELGLGEDEPLPDPSTIEIDTAPERVSQHEVRELQRLRRKLIALEPVNPLAAGELAEVGQRHDFLAAQKEDLERAMADLRALADELARSIAEQFSATLQAVDREFAAFFSRLFNGGTASLRLSDEEEEAGIDIVARPPGKRLSSLAQLSGGERALTATALLLAILRVKPAPFCVLDEVDAALDERNIGRFTQALRELTDRTQFVVITHNRGTIEAADALYGVSMDTSGVSKVVSLRLADLERERTG